MARRPRAVRHRRRRPTSTGRVREARTRIRTLGGFGVFHDGSEVPLAAWGSRRARTLCKRLAASAGEPVPREQLIELLWPDELDPAPLPARLSVQLSTVRRLLGGGVIADRDSVRLDLREVELDLADLLCALRDGDDERAATLYGGEFLPEDVYADWAAAPRDRARRGVLGALARLAATTTDADTRRRSPPAGARPRSVRRRRARAADQSAPRRWPPRRGASGPRSLHVADARPRHNGPSARRADDLKLI